MNEPPVLFSKSGSIVRLTLNRPDKLNAVNRAMHAALRAGLDEAAGDPQCRVVILTGAGRAFSAGQDLADSVQDHSGPQLDASSLLEELYNPLLKRITTFDKPVIAAVNGIAAGASANIALACDLVIAARSASFLQAFTRIGLVPDAGGTWTLPRLVGPARARGLAMLAEPLAAEKAEAWGLIWKCVDDAAFEAEVTALAEKLASSATYALALTKRAIAEAATNTLAQQLDLEARLQKLAGASPDAIEGIKAFLEKRRANFSGRKA